MVVTIVKVIFDDFMCLYQFEVSSTLLLSFIFIIFSYV